MKSKIRRLIDNNYAIYFVLFIALILRVWKLASIPPHLTADEASLGYNAYSILNTAKDEYGEFLPIIFKSFGDYKPGLYIYLTVPFVAIFGLSEFAVRLPSAITGVIAVWLVYLIVNELLGYELRVRGSENKMRNTLTRNNLTAVTASILLTFNPWHIQFSRGAWETNVALTLTLTGIYLFLKSFNKQKYLLYSSLFFSLTFLTYQGAKLSTTIVILILFFLYWKKVKKLSITSKRILIASALLALIITLPIFLSLAQGKTGRLGVFSVFSYPRSEELIREILNQGNEKSKSMSYLLYHSETLNFVRGIAGRWFNHFSSRFLFFEGDYQNPRHSAPNHGMLMLFDLVFLPIGLIFMLRRRNKFTDFVFLWLILSPLPAVLSRDQVHAVRALNMVIPLTLVSALGTHHVVEIYSRKKKFMKYIFFSFLVFLFLAPIIYFLDSYFIHLPKHNSKYWSYGYKQIVQIVSPIQTDFRKIKVQQSFAQPYIYFLFFQSYDPVKYQQQANLVESEYKGDVGYIEKLDNIYFSHMNWPEDKKDSGTLVIADTIVLPEEELSQTSNIELLGEVNYLNGESAFRIVEVR